MSVIFNLMKISILSLINDRIELNLGPIFLKFDNLFICTCLFAIFAMFSSNWVIVSQGEQFGELNVLVRITQKNEKKTGLSFALIRYHNAYYLR